MRTLKKTLSLVMVIALCVSLFVVTASAASFTDADDINEDYATAVAAMSDLGIIEGYDDGSFQPGTVLTREQGAKIIAYLMVGSSADGLSTSSAPFNDVAANRWSAGYIAYCVSQGIINGYGDGNFGPADTLTGYQFAKMLLVALGYGKDNEYVGASWQINVAKDALKNGIFEGNLGANYNAGITREEACLYAYNTLFIETVLADIQYDMGKKYVDGYYGTGSTLGIDLYKVFEVTGVITAVDPIEGKTTIEVEDDPYLADGGYTVKATSSWADIGKIGTAFCKFKNLTPTGITSTYSETVTVTDNTVGTKAGPPLANMINPSNSAYVCKLDNSFVVYYNGIPATIVKSAPSSGDPEGYYFYGTTLSYWNGANNTEIGNGAGRPISLIDNDGNGKADVITYSQYKAAKVTSINANAETITIAPNGGTSIVLDFEDINGYEDLDIAKNDYITYIVYDGVYYINVCSSFEGKVTSYSTSGPKVGIDGTNYNKSADCYSSVTGIDATKIGNSYKFYVDEYGNLVYATEGAVSSTAVAYVNSVDSVSFNGYQDVQLYFPDGTSEVVTVKSCNFSGTFGKPGASGNAVVANTIVSYSEDSDGYYTLTKQTTGVNVAGGGTTLEITNNNPTIVFGGTTNVVTTTTTKFVDIKNDVVVTGYKDVPSQTVSIGAAFVERGVATVVFINDTDATHTSKDKVFILDTAYSATDEDGVRVYSFNAVVNGEVTTIECSSDAARDTVETNGPGVYRITKIGSNGYVTEWNCATKDDDMTAYVTATDNSSYMTLSATINGYDTWILDDDTVYVYIDISDKSASIVTSDSLIAGDDTLKIYAENSGPNGADPMTASVVYIVHA